MVVGIITGTYSSVFIAAAIVSFWRGSAPTRAAAHAPATPPRRRRSSRRASRSRSGRRARRKARAARTLTSHDRIFQAALLGVVQGLTEFLPVSSTAHLLHRRAACSASTIRAACSPCMIQLGSILAVDVAVSREDRRRGGAACRRRPEARRFALLIVAGDGPGARRRRSVCRTSSKRVLYDSLAVIAAAFIVGGIVMLVVERVRPGADVPDADADADRRARSASASCQTLALVPGVSRSGATIVGGHAAGLDRPAAARVLVLSRDADDDRGVRARPARGAAPSRPARGARDRRRLRRWRSSRRRWSSSSRS